MIRFSATGNDGRPILGLGLSQRNWDKLMKGDPIVVETKECGLPMDMVIIIIGGENEAAILSAMVKDHNIEMPTDTNDIIIGREKQ